MDLYADPPGTPIQSAARYEAHLGGSSANIAVALRQQGAEVSLVTSVSDDPVGEFCLAQLDHYGIERDYVRKVGGEARNSLSVVDTCGAQTQSVIYRNHAADFQMTTDDINLVDFAGFSALITTGTVFASEPSRNATFHAIERAKSAGVPLIFDVDYRPYSWASADEAEQVYSRAAELCDIVIGNDVEFGFMAGAIEKGLEKARSLARGSGRVIVYKMGEKGAITITKDGELQTGIYPVDALKPTGAGDSFMGGFIAALSAGHPIEKSVLRGSACASIVVSRVGCAPAMPSASDIDDFIAKHAGPTLVPVS
ncbi:5-dehydro-2-deoxygluconokinase [Aliiroseovarius sp. 2305UL8-7]|uniref:5-dehydro-2-deoxygluconokinase n=1 Tax=Aliiroseovarius conchicola TaxID=3121637 RepID=UPI003528589D